MKKSKIFDFKFKKKGKPTWVPADKTTGRPGYWVPSYARVTVAFKGLCVVFPTLDNEKTLAFDCAIKRMIEELQALRTSHEGKE